MGCALCCYDSTDSKRRQPLAPWPTFIVCAATDKTVQRWTLVFGWVHTRRRHVVDSSRTFEQLVLRRHGDVSVDAQAWRPQVVGPFDGRQWHRPQASIRTCDE